MLCYFGWPLNVADEISPNFSAFILTHCGLVMSYGNIDLDTHNVSRSGLLPDSDKQLPEPMLTCDQIRSMVSCGTHLRQFQKKFNQKYQFEDFSNVLLKSSNWYFWLNFFCLPTHICVTRSQWVKVSWLINAFELFIYPRPFRNCWVGLAKSH